MCLVTVPRPDEHPVSTEALPAKPLATPSRLGGDNGEVSIEFSVLGSVAAHDGEGNTIALKDPDIEPYSLGCSSPGAGACLWQRSSTTCGRTRRRTPSAR